MADQPIPEVTDADVERVVRRDFDPSDVPEVRAMLEEYGTESWQGEVDRVRLAALRLADGSVERLRRAVETAKLDYRDVIAPAEYPDYLRRVSPSRPPSAEEVERIIEADWAQYRDWLGEGS